MFPDTPTTKDHFNAVFAACVLCTGRVKDTFELTDPYRTPLSQVKCLPTVTRLVGQTARMKNRG